MYDGCGQWLILPYGEQAIPVDDEPVYVDEPEPEPVTPFGVLTLQPADVVLLLTENSLPIGLKEHVEKLWSERLGQQVYVLDGGRTLAAVRRGGGVGVFWGDGA